MTYGLLAGMRACFSALVLNCILVYTFACGMVIFLKHEAEANEAIKQVSESIDVHCERLGNCMWLLMIDGTFLLDGTGVVLSSLVFGFAWRSSKNTFCVDRGIVRGGVDNDCRA